MGMLALTAQLQSNMAAYPKPGPLPVVLLPFQFRQQICLKGWQELLHHQVTQDLQGKGDRRTSVDEGQLEVS